MSYIVWRLADADLDLWLPTDCDTFAQASDAWLTIIHSGGRAEIMERVPIALRDARGDTPPPVTKPHTPRGESRTALIVKALHDAPDGLSRAELARITGLAKTHVGASVTGLQKLGKVRTKQEPPTDARGMPGVGRETVTVYFLD